MLQTLPDRLGQQGESLMARVMGYENPELVERFKDKLDLSHNDASDLFDDVKRFLYLSGTRPGVWSPTEPIDAGWHEFILYTVDYSDFCATMFGRYLHHVPRSYLDSSKQTKGRMWATLEVAKMTFGDLTSNWDVPDDKRPPATYLSAFDAAGDDPCAASCGCQAACNDTD